MARKHYHELFSGVVCNEDQAKFRDAVMDDSNNSCFARLMEHMEGFEGYIKCDLPISYRGRLAMHIDKL